MRITRDPASGVEYTALPWHDVPIGSLADRELRNLVSLTHYQLVRFTLERSEPTIDARLEALAHTVAEVYNGLLDEDGERLAAEWGLAWSDIARCGHDGVLSWAAVYGESTGGWWPPGSSAVTRGIVNGVVRSSYAEDLHTGDRACFYGNQLGSMCVNWAAVSLLDELVVSDPPASGPVSGESQQSAFREAATRFPAGWAVITALGRCLATGETSSPVTLPDGGSIDEAVSWIADHAGTATISTGNSAAVTGAQARDVTVRHAWSAPLPDELEEIAEIGGLATVSLTRLSRNPLHLAATLQWAVRSSVRLMTPNLLIDSTRVSYRHPLVPAPSPTDDDLKGQASHSSSWQDRTGLSDDHLSALGLPPGADKIGRNEPCPCGSGAKCKRCHGR